MKQSKWARDWVYGMLAEEGRGELQAYGGLYGCDSSCPWHSKLQLWDGFSTARTAAIGFIHVCLSH